MTPEQYFSTYAADAIAAMKVTGIPASVSLAQGALESNYGVAIFGNNQWGIKANKEWSGDKQLLRTTEVLRFATIESYKMATGQEFPEVISIEPYPPIPAMSLWHIRDYFRMYPTAEAGFIDHANFFKVNGRYSQALLDEKDYAKFAEDISHAGYASAPNYGETLIKIITEHNLSKYDL